MMQRKNLKSVFKFACAALALASTGASMAQPAPGSSVIPATTLVDLPHHDISNGIVSAKVYLPGRKREPGDCRTENYVTRALCQ